MRPAAAVAAAAPSHPHALQLLLSTHACDSLRPFSVSAGGVTAQAILARSKLERAFRRTWMAWHGAEAFLDALYVSDQGLEVASWSWHFQ